MVVFCGVDLCENWARVTCDVCKDIFFDTLTFFDGKFLSLALIVRLFHFLLLLIYTGGGGSSKAESLTDKLCTGLFVVVEFFFGVSWRSK